MVKKIIDSFIIMLLSVTNKRTIIPLITLSVYTQNPFEEKVQVIDPFYDETNCCVCIHVV